VPRRFDSDFCAEPASVRNGDDDVADGETLATLPGEDQHGEFPKCWHDLGHCNRNGMPPQMKYARS